MRGDNRPENSATSVFLEFPTCVGMNRPRRQRNVSISGVPHMRGDEPSC